MLDLAGLPRGAFAGALQYNLERFQSLPKVFEHFLSAIATHLGADAAWLIRTLRENRPVREGHELGAPRFRDESLASRFLRNERPEILGTSFSLRPGRASGPRGNRRHEKD
jgi:hypothetical protein